MGEATLEQRIARLEALDAIRQLPAKYALALDMRDMDAMVSLFPEDVRVGKDAVGRAALRASSRRAVRHGPALQVPEGLVGEDPDLGPARRAVRRHRSRQAAATALANTVVGRSSGFARSIPLISAPRLG